jgi:hypothetical protein
MTHVLLSILNKIYYYQEYKKVEDSHNLVGVIFGGLEKIGCPPIESARRIT